MLTACSTARDAIGRPIGASVLPKTATPDPMLGPMGLGDPELDVIPRDAVRATSNPL